MRRVSLTKHLSENSRLNEINERFRSPPTIRSLLPGQATPDTVVANTTVQFKEPSKLPRVRSTLSIIIVLSAANVSNDNKRGGRDWDIDCKPWNYNAHRSKNQHDHRNKKKTICWFRVHCPDGTLETVSVAVEALPLVITAPHFDKDRSLPLSNLAPPKTRICA